MSSVDAARLGGGEMVDGGKDGNTDMATANDDDGNARVAVEGNDNDNGKDTDKDSNRAAKRLKTMTDERANQSDVTAATTTRATATASASATATATAVRLLPTASKPAAAAAVGSSRASPISNHYRHRMPPPRWVGELYLEVTNDATFILKNCKTDLVLTASTRMLFLFKNKFWGNIFIVQEAAYSDEVAIRCHSDETRSSVVTRHDYCHCTLTQVQLTILRMIFFPISTTAYFFANIVNIVSLLSNLQLHSGTLTSQAKIKKQNRQCESMLKSVEALLVYLYVTMAQMSEIILKGTVNTFIGLIIRILIMIVFPKLLIPLLL
jgi:hypothetical protein